MYVEGSPASFEREEKSRVRIKTDAGSSVNELMSTRLAVSGYIGLVVYCLLSLLWGPMGFRAYSELEDNVGRMRENLASLEALHEEARARLESVQSDPDTLALEARSLGYVKEGEVVVRVGFPEGEPSHENLGTLIPCVAPSGKKDAEIKSISIVAALCAFFLSLMVHGPKRGRAGRNGNGLSRSRSAAGREIPGNGRA